MPTITITPGTEYVFDVFLTDNADVPYDITNISFKSDIAQTAGAAPVCSFFPSKFVSEGRCRFT